MSTRPTQDTEPLVSVIVPTYNYARFIIQTLDSLRAQTYENWECVVVDDGSTDDTREVVAGVASRDARVRYFRQENRGQPAALNVGLRLFTGELLQILDADDLIEPRKLELHTACLLERPEVDIVYGDVRYFRGDDVGERLHTMRGENTPRKLNVSGAGRGVLRRLVHSNITTVNAPLMRRRVVEAVGEFDERLAPVQDWDYWLRCALAAMRFRYDAPEGSLALVRVPHSSASQNLARMYRATLLTRAKLGGLLDDAELRSLNSDMAAADEGYLGVELAAAGAWHAGMRHMFAAAARERKTRWRLKWLACALATPFVSGQRLRSLVSGSLTSALAGRRGDGGSPV
jgi:glycosyltransferase involved in cell wall biosynthesis